MKSFFTAFKRQNGFTLVELMVVVAIIGLLSAVAIPNFKKYQAKSKISEAKLHLSSLYTAESAFFSDYNMYGQCLRYMGYDPSKERTNRYYGVGLSAGATARDATAHAAALNSGMQDLDCPATNAVLDDTPAATGANPASWFPAGKGIGANLIDRVAKAAANRAGTAVATCTETTVGTGGSAAANQGTCIGSQSTSTGGGSTMVFQMSAVGFISGDFVTDATASGLTINHNKILKQVVNGY
jgi:prepilin-type N-terminal cleavage/methylation domain-containing protein